MTCLEILSYVAARGAGGDGREVLTLSDRFHGAVEGRLGPLRENAITAFVFPVLRDRERVASR
eukprot:2966028-Amphidinium_carterae.1